MTSDQTAGFVLFITSQLAQHFQRILWGIVHIYIYPSHLLLRTEEIKFICYLMYILWSKNIIAEYTAQRKYVIFQWKLAGHFIPEAKMLSALYWSFSFTNGKNLIGRASYQHRNNFILITICFAYSFIIHVYRQEVFFTLKENTWLTFNGQNCKAKCYQR